VRSRIAVFIIIIQSVLFLAHLAVYRTLLAFWGAPSSEFLSTLRVTFVLLSVSFVTASLIGFRYSNILVRVFYTLAAAWLGTLSFCFYAACSCWIVYTASNFAGVHLERRPLAAILFGLAVLASIYGIANAARTRVARITVRLPNLPEAWRGRVAALVSDLHLGHVRNRGFAERIVAMLSSLRADIVFIAGDLYDGTTADIDRLAQPFSKLSPPFGTYFVAGNHEEFSDHTKYLNAIARAGVRVLNNEKLNVDGLQIVGVHYLDSNDPGHYRSILQRASIDRGRASILVVHAPHNLPIAEEEGISLQLSGHTHGGQFAPYTLIVSRIYGPFAYGLQRLGQMLVYTSCGAGTWGPPLRVGTNPEIVLIRFE
jgi:predicted MPP superfamily phosphohydrolase